jgi:hypothetical protein
MSQPTWKWALGLALTSVGTVLTYFNQKRNSMADVQTAYDRANLDKSLRVMENYLKDHQDGKDWIREQIKWRSASGNYTMTTGKQMLSSCALLSNLIPCAFPR